LFDLDGTLLDTLQDLGDSVNHALCLSGYPPLPYEDYRQLVGHGVSNLCSEALHRSMTDGMSRRLVPDSLDQQAFLEAAELVLSRFKAHYAKNLNVRTTPYPGVGEALMQIRDAGIIIGVLSNKSQNFTEELIQVHFSNIDFGYIIGDGGKFPRKPDPSSIRYILEKSGYAAGQTVLFGDGETDIQASISAGVDAVAVCWGFRDRRSLAEAGAETFISSPGEIAKIVFEGLKND
jgi:phosphoglycolate phosphatase